VISTERQPLELWSGDPSDLYGLLDRAARDLHRNLRDGYTQGFESDLTNYLLGAYTANAEADSEQWTALVNDGLSFLVQERMQDFISVDCLLDDTESSYNAVGTMAETLLAAIRAQNNEYDALRRLVVNEIVDRSRSEYVIKPQTAAGCKCDQLYRCAGCGTYRHQCVGDGEVWICINPNCTDG
jgi:hypothetical protein